MGEKQEKIKKPKITESLELLTQQILSMSESLNKLIVILSVPNHPITVESAQERKLVSNIPPQVITEQPVSAPIPFEYKQLVNEILNSSFEILLYPRSDSPAFEFVISVPKKYSNATLPHWETYNNDLRPKVIEYAQGLNGVREWCERVFNNLNQDVRAMILQDRINAK